VDSDDEEERKLLLSDSVPPSPVVAPRLAWTPSTSSSAMTDSQDRDGADKLRLGAAEEQFLGLAMESGGEQQDCLQVVSSILSDLDTDIHSDQSDACAACSQLPHTRALVVDVHAVSSAAGKHTADRVAQQQRCHSTESDRQLRNDQLDNCDRIETVGEDRCRHMSESALGLHWTLARRKRAATMATGPSIASRASSSNTEAASILAHTRHSTGLDFGATLDTVQQCRSTDTLAKGGEVKFDIWEEADMELGEEENKEENNICDHNLESGAAADTVDGGGGDHDDSFHYAQHPLVTELYNCYTMPGGTLSHSSSTSSMPICRICQLPSMEPHNTLISPCRCLGSIRYVHNPCLAKWLEVCSRKTGEPPVCELCQYQYIRHKKFVISNWRVPSISAKDRVLHSVFLTSILIMIICSVATILSFKQADTLPKVGPDTELSSSELLTLSCGVLFFFSFFVAMYVEVKAEFTIYQLICKFFQMNHEWTILEYDKARDRIKRDTVGIKGSFP